MTVPQNVRIPGSPRILSSGEGHVFPGHRRVDTPTFPCTLQGMTYTNIETGKRWGYTDSGELWCEECDGTSQVTVPGHGEMENFDCEGSRPHKHSCETCET